MVPLWVILDRTSLKGHQVAASTTQDDLLREVVWVDTVCSVSSFKQKCFEAFKLNAQVSEFMIVHDSLVERRPLLTDD